MGKPRRPMQLTPASQPGPATCSGGRLTRARPGSHVRRRAANRGPPRRPTGANRAPVRASARSPGPAYRRLPRGLAGRPRVRVRVTMAPALSSARPPRVARWWPLRSCGTADQVWVPHDVSNLALFLSSSYELQSRQVICPFRSSQ
jgi:hypothetical protein